MIESPEMAADLGKVRDTAKMNKVNAYNQLRELTRNDDMLKWSGYKTLEEATKDIVKRTDAENEKLIRGFEKRWPDKE